MATLPRIHSISMPPSLDRQIVELRQMLRHNRKTFLIGEGSDRMLELPRAAQDILMQILDDAPTGAADSILPAGESLTTQAAAAILGVSRPFLVKLLDSGKLPHHLVGTHRRVYRKDLLAYKEYRDRERHEALNRMAQAAEDADVYDKVLLPEE